MGGESLTWGSRKEKEPAILDVLLVSHVLSEVPEIEGIEVFGSVARKGVGNDFDLIFIVSEDISKQFLEEAKQRLNTKHFGIIPKGLMRTRMSVAMDILGDKFRTSIEEMRKLKPGTRFDCFLFPSDWRKRLDELQKALPHRNPYFMRNIAKDAIKVL